jgi:uncharacterized membrane protein YfcA
VSPAKVLLLTLLAIAAVLFAGGWILQLRRRRGWQWPNGYLLGVGFVTNLFDTLGIGSFATTTALYRLRRTVADEDIPGTLNVGHCLPTVAQALIYLNVIEVDELTLTTLIVAAVLGAWLGAGAVTKLSRRRIQLGMGLGMLLAASLMLMRLLKLFPGGGDELALHGAALVAASIGVFILGALMTVGVGAYAPIMIMVSLLGMNLKAAFPIMMGSCAFLTCAGSLRFVRADRYNRAAAIGLAVGGIPAVLIAAYLVKELPLEVVRTIVVVVVVYTAITLLVSAMRRSSASAMVAAPTS